VSSADHRRDAGSAPGAPGASPWLGLPGLPPAEPGRATARLSLDPQQTRKGICQLVLALVELIRRLLEKQALRRMESGTLSDAEIERLGLSLLALEEQMQWLKNEFGLTDEDLNLDLGPLGTLI
jgi:hypothetical protein